ncbi:MAG: 2-aminoethylphosphonate--pyruvate transaminase [Gammaproteobacteria bacterium]|nr:2-aminoethylphosphonate--pyruvate transaminase [Gammaproteobacteria bacterium]
MEPPPKTDPLLLTPGPLTTSATVKQAMLHDYGSRDIRFIEMNRRICAGLLSLCDAGETHLCIPLQGSGSFAVEAMIANQLPRDGKLLNLVNGAYGHRITEICRYLGREVSVLETGEDQPVDPADLARVLESDAGITHVTVVYCETTSGILNPVPDIAQVVANHGRSLLIDAMSAFGALPLSASNVPFAALAGSANKCLESVPGLGFVIADKASFPATEGNAHSLSLDLYKQWHYMNETGQWRFTPPTHCLLALDTALQELEREGGIPARGRRYQENCRVLVNGMRELGFETLLPDGLQAPVIVTFLMPENEAFSFTGFYRRLSDLGFVIYPGKLTDRDSFRIGCIGSFGADEMRAAVAAVKQVLQAMGIRNLGSE